MLSEAQRLAFLKDKDKQIAALEKKRLVEQEVKKLNETSTDKPKKGRPRKKTVEDTKAPPIPTPVTTPAVTLPVPPVPDPEPQPSTVTPQAETASQSKSEDSGFRYDMFEDKLAGRVADEVFKRLSQQQSLYTTPPPVEIKKPKKTRKPRARSSSEPPGNAKPKPEVRTEIPRQSFTWM